MYRTYSDRYYSDSDERSKIKADWNKYVTDNFQDLKTEKVNLYLKIGETIYKYQRSLNIDKLSVIRETSWLEIIKLLKKYEDNMINEILIDFQNKIDPDYALNIFKKIIQSKKYDKKESI